MSRRAPYRVFVYAVLACAMFGAALASTAQAADFFMKGNVRGQIGDGLPVPITFAPAPDGPITGSGTVSQSGADPMNLKLPASFFARPKAPFSLPVALLNNIAMQVFTSISVLHPAYAATFSQRVTSASVLVQQGRPGPATVTWCPGNGQVMTATNYTVTVGNPGCLDPAATGVRGRVKYLATGNQFGGNAPARVPRSPATPSGVIQGYADVVVRTGPSQADLPCDYNMTTTGTCKVAFANAAPNEIGAAGWKITGTTGNQIPSAVFDAIIASNGKVEKLANGTTGGYGPVNTAAGGGGPWTTGKVVITAVSLPDTPPTEVFTLTGSDNRVGGLGTLSLVSGAASNRTVTGPNGNRGWMNLSLVRALPRPVPGLSTGAVLMLVALVAGATLFLVRRAMVAAD